MLKSRPFLVWSFACVSAVALTLANATPSFAVDCCSLNGGPCNIIPPLVHGTSPWTGSACGTTISGTNCDAELSTDVSTASGACITLGSGVTFDLKGNSITCTDEDCVAAVRNSSSSGSSNKVVITNGEIHGCWQRGVWVDGGSDSSVSDLHVDLTRNGGGACNNGGVLSAGILTPRGTISRSTVYNAFTCIYAQPGEDITDTLVEGCFNCLDGLGSSAAAVSLTNLQVLNCGYSLKNLNPGTFLPDARNVSLQNPAGACHCLDATNTCVTDIEDCIDFSNSSGAGNASFIDRTVIP